MGEVHARYEIPNALHSRAMQVLTEAGFIAEISTDGAEPGRVIITARALYDDDGPDAQAVHMALCAEALNDAGIPAAFKSHGVTIASGAWRSVHVDGHRSAMKIIGRNETEWATALDGLAKAAGIDRDRLTLSSDDDPYRKLLDSE
jgi:hypothetical protein